MTDTQLLVAILCISPLVTFGLCAVWRILELNSRDGDTKRYPRPGTEPFRPESKIKPFRKSSDMLTKIDDE
jgi:hypothetical protein